VALRIDVTPLDEPARSFRYEFDGDRAQILLGRRGGVDVLLPHAKVSLVHARIEHRGDGYFLVDDGSTNGTTLNGAALATGQYMALRDGDRAVIGDFALSVGITDGAPDGSAESAASVARRMVREVMERLGPAETQPSLLVLDGTQAGLTLTLQDAGRVYVLGRGATGELRLDDVDMWQEHAALVRDDHGVTVRDVGSTSQLTVNRRSVEGQRLLRDGDVVMLGTTSLRYIDPAEVYLRKLETARGQDDTSPTERPREIAPPAARPELLFLGIGVTVALAAVAALVYVLFS
jgi:pSer/pThr/pTyr-binding forkhead associated (FHA) protein